MKIKLFFIIIIFSAFSIKSSEKNTPQEETKCCQYKKILGASVSCLAIPVTSAVGCIGGSLKGIITSNSKRCSNFTIASGEIYSSYCCTLLFCPYTSFLGSILGGVVGAEELPRASINFLRLYKLPSTRMY
jgi:hypothetical protein